MRTANAPLRLLDRGLRSPGGKGGMSDRPFARVYYIDLERDYPEIYRDNDVFSTYVRLLGIADAMWPAVPEVPRSARASFVKKLVEASLVRMVPPYGFSIKGMDAERNARSNAARIAARSRWSSAEGNASAMPTPVQSSPDQPVVRIASKKNGAILDERDLSPEDYAKRYEALQAERTGVKQ